MIRNSGKPQVKKIFQELSILDKCLPLFIICSIILGILLSVYVPLSRKIFQGASVLDVSIPVVIGLIIMMIPPLCKVEWETFGQLQQYKKYQKSILVSLVLNWLVCPFLMYGLAWLTLFDEPEFRVGMIMIGMARCVAMVLLWNEIAGGDNSLCAILVIINSLLQIVLYAPYQVLFCYVMGGDNTKSNVSYELVARNVGFFLGIPLGLGLLLRFSFIYTVGIKNFEKIILPFISPWSLIGLLYTIIVIFIEKGDAFIKEIRSAFRCFVPLIIYFLVAWFGTFYLYRWWSTTSFALKFNNENDYESDEELTDLLKCGCKEKSIKNPQKWVFGCAANYKETITQTFTAASNNFELSLAVAISIYGTDSKQAIAATFGPLLEIPILITLAFVARLFRYKYLWSDVEEDDIESSDA